MTKKAKKSLEEEKSELFKLIDSRFDKDYFKYLQEMEKIAMDFEEDKFEYQLKYNYRGAFNAG
jgi:hypothetical protein